MNLFTESHKSFLERAADKVMQKLSETKMTIRVEFTKGNVK